MALTNTELEERILVIESTLNTIQTALNNVPIKKTLNASIALKQQEIDALKDRVSALESQIQILQQNS